MADSIRIKNLIDGEWLVGDNETTVALYNPSTGAQIGEAPMSSAATVEAAVKSSHAAYLKWREVPIGKRVGYIFAIHTAMQDNLEKLAVSIAIDQAKHVSDQRSAWRSSTRY